MGLAGRAALCLAGAVLLVAGLSAPASAAGDPALDRLITVEPVAGWSAWLPPATTMHQLESALASTSSVFGRATFALQYWRSPDGTQVIGILLARTPGVPISGDALQKAAAGSCTGGDVTPTSGVSPGYEVSCTEGSVGSPVQATVVSTAKSSTLVLVLAIANGEQPLPVGQVVSIAAQQQQLLPTSPVPTIVGSLLLAVIGLVLAAAAATIWLVRRTSRRARSAFPGPIPPWAAAPGGSGPLGPMPGPGWSPPPPVAWPHVGPAPTSGPAPANDPAPGTSFPPPAAGDPEMPPGSGSGQAGPRR